MTHILSLLIAGALGLGLASSLLGVCIEAVKGIVIF